MSSLADHVNPFPGQVIRQVNFGPPGWYEENVGEYRPTVMSPDYGTVVTSEVANERWSASGTHKPVLDIDLPVTLIESSTPGHFHLFIDKELPWHDYLKLLTVLAELGIIEEGYLSASKSRKHTAVRLPWIKKEVSDG